MVKVDRRIRWHYTTTILRLRIGARLTRYRNCKFHNFARTISRHADGISRYSVPPSAGPLLPLVTTERRAINNTLACRPEKWVTVVIVVASYSSHSSRQVSDRLGTQRTATQTYEERERERERESEVVRDRVGKREALRCGA